MAVNLRTFPRVCLKYCNDSLANTNRNCVASANRNCVRLRHACLSIDNRGDLKRYEPTCLSHVSKRTVAHNLKSDGKAPELSMNDVAFSDYVKHLVENKAIIPPYDSMLTAKLGDYDLRVADLFELSVVLDEDGDLDDEFRQLARLDMIGGEEARRKVEEDILGILLSAVEEEEVDTAIDKSSTTIEFEGGAGGQESMIFNGEVFEMYRNFAGYRGWSFDVTEYEGENSMSGSFALSKAAADVKGKGAYDLLKFEAGVHRVQRVPATGKRSGQLQTSTCVVIVTPTVTVPQIKFKPQDLKFSYTKSSGPGGQAVNTANSAVRVTHIPTGLVVECQEERTAHINSDIAVDKLRQKLYFRERERILSSNQRQRRVQIGTRERSEKIRTYNFPQGRVTDHRVAINAGAPEKLFEGGAELEELIESVSHAHQTELLLERLRKFKEKRS